MLGALHEDQLLAVAQSGVSVRDLLALASTCKSIRRTILDSR
eukprot:SAG31_NODE_39388_length_288_cov_1.365079_1_plen_41_part_01